jgi:outer membrane protein
VAILLLFQVRVLLRGQETVPESTQSPTAAAQGIASVHITLDEAILRARNNEPAFAAAVAASQVSSLDRSIAHASLLPNVTYHNQFIYTQPANGATGSNNASTNSPSIGSCATFYRQ